MKQTKTILENKLTRLWKKREANRFDGGLARRDNDGFRYSGVCPIYVYGRL